MQNWIWKASPYDFQIPWGLILKYSHCTLPQFLLSCSPSESPRAASGLYAEDTFGHLQMDSTITARLSRELHTQRRAARGCTAGKCLRGHSYNTLHTWLSGSHLPWATGPILYFSKKEAKLIPFLQITARDLEPHFDPVLPEDQSCKDQKPQEQLLQEKEIKLTSLLSCRNITVTRPAVRAISSRFGTAPQYCSKSNWATQEAQQCC